MKVKRLKNIYRKNPIYPRDYLKPYIEIKLTFDESIEIMDYIKSDNKNSASGLLKSKLEEILK